jgi:transcriptional regulator with XRE-family HTH domain
MNIPFTISGLRKIGLTQTQIGLEIGLKQPSISDMESGKAGITNPSSRVEKGLAALAAKHNVPTEPGPSSNFNSLSTAVTQVNTTGETA